MKKFLLILLALMLILVSTSLTACGPTQTTTGINDSILPIQNIEYFEVPADFKIGLILLHDENSTYDLNFMNGLNAVKAALKLKDEQVIMKRNIPEGNDCYEAAIELVAKGCKIIFADSFGHESYLAKAAAENPTVQFCHATGTTAHTLGLSNFHNAFAAIYEGRYLAGVAAGLKLNELKEANKLKGDHPVIGYIGAFTYAEVISGYTSFYLGAKSVCPDVTMKVQFTGSWYDEAEENNAAQALIAGGADLISQHADSLGAPTACENAGIPNVSYNGSTYDAGEHTFIISSAINWSPYFAHIIKCWVEGKQIEADWTGTIASGSVILTGINPKVAAKDTEAKLKTVIDQFKNGTLHVYDVTKDNYITVKGEKLSSYLADVDTDAAYTPDTEAIKNGYFHESEYRSAPYFDLLIDGITLMNQAF
jgi:basic membrane protein A